MTASKLLKRSLLALGAVLFMGCETTTIHEHRTPPPSRPGPPAHAPAHGYRAKHVYRYYPDCHVYYEPARSTWWYIEGGNWRFGASLPSTVIVSGSYVSIDMDIDRPYVEYESHKVKYPGHGKYDNQGSHKGGGPGESSKGDESRGKGKSKGKGKNK